MSDNKSGKKPGSDDLVAKFMADDAATTDLGPCAICGRPATPEYRPFCTRRCADVDLGRWLRGSYAIPAGRDDDDEEDREAVDRDA